MNLPLLASTLVEKDIWYPTILGILVVVFAVLLFCGSVYLLLATNMGARLGFLVAFTCLMGFMVVLTALWITTASPLNTLRGRDPHWEAVEVVEDPTAAQAEEIHDIESEGRKLTAADAADVKAAADEALVTVQAVPGEAQVAQRFAEFAEVTDYLVVNTYETGGSSPNPLDFELTHEELFAVIEFCEVAETNVPFGTAPPPPECAAGEDTRFIVLSRDLGSTRVPPVVAFVASTLLFGLGLLALHWREKDERAAKRAAEAKAAAADAADASADTAPVPEKV